MSNLTQEIQKFETAGYIELFDINTTVIGGTQIYRYTPMNFSTTNVSWKNQLYIPFPIEATGFEWNGTTNSPPKPTLTVSNVNQFLMAAVISLGDLVGAKVTRWRTFTKFLDGQPTADSNAHFIPDVFLVDQKTTHSKIQIQWSLISPLDRTGLSLPRRQILKDETSYGVAFPGVARTRIR
jgi:lambda family phage minor tail protein L